MLSFYALNISRKLKGVAIANQLGLPTTWLVLFQSHSKGKVTILRIGRTHFGEVVERKGV